MLWRNIQNGDLSQRETVLLIDENELISAQVALRKNGAATIFEVATITDLIDYNYEISVHR